MRASFYAIHTGDKIKECHSSTFRNKHLLRGSKAEAPYRKYPTITDNVMANL